MNLRELLLLGLVLWTAIGVVGTLISLAQRERTKARRGIVWLAAVWIVYLITELAVARTQPQRIVVIGQEQCFDEMCFTVTGMQEVPGFFGRNASGRDKAGDGSRLLRIMIRIQNRGSGRAQSEKLIRSYLVDRHGRRWNELPGLTGVPLTTPVAPGNSVVSEPVFQVPPDADGLGLVFTHGRWQPGVLVIGDSDSLGHRPTLVPLEH